MGAGCTRGDDTRRDEVVVQTREASRAARRSAAQIAKVCGRGVRVRPNSSKSATPSETGNVPTRTRAHGVPLTLSDPLVRLLLRVGGGRPAQAHDQLELRHERGQPHLQPHALGLAGAASLRTTPPLPSPPPTPPPQRCCNPLKSSPPPPPHLHRRTHHRHNHRLPRARPLAALLAHPLVLTLSLSLARPPAARRSSSPRAPRSIRTCTWRIASRRSRLQRSDPAHHESRAAPAAAGASAGGHRAG